MPRTPVVSRTITFCVLDAIIITDGEPFQADLEVPVICTGNLREASAFLRETGQIDENEEVVYAAITGVKNIHLELDFLKYIVVSDKKFINSKELTTRIPISRDGKDSRVTLKTLLNES